MFSTVHPISIVVFISALVSVFSSETQAWPGGEMGFNWRTAGYLCGIYAPWTASCQSCACIHTFGDNVWGMTPSEGTGHVMISSGSSITQTISMSSASSTNGFDIDYTISVRHGSDSASAVLKVNGNTMCTFGPTSSTTWVEADACTISSSQAQTFGGTMVLEFQASGSALRLDDVRLSTLPPSPQVPPPPSPQVPPPLTPQVQDGAVIEMTGDEPKLIFGTLENPTCQLSLDRPNARLVSTCSIQDSRRRLEETFDCEGKHAALEQKYQALRSEVSELHRLADELKAAAGVE
jgi:hypothetical protein